jgi:hypothetical protein
MAAFGDASTRQTYRNANRDDPERLSHDQGRRLLALRTQANSPADIRCRFGSTAVCPGKPPPAGPAAIRLLRPRPPAAAGHRSI